MTSSQYCMDTINRYRITEENVVGDYKLETSDYDVMEVIIVCLHDGEKKRKHSKMIDMLSVLFSDKLNGEKKQKILKKDYKLKMTQEYKEVVNSMCYITDVCNRKLKEQQEEFDEKLANQQEEFDEKLASQQEKFDEKLANQQEKFDEKLAEEKRKTVLNMLADNLSDETVIRYTCITSEELAEIKAGIKA